MVGLMPLASQSAVERSRVGQCVSSASVVGGVIQYTRRWIRPFAGLAGTVAIIGGKAASAGARGYLRESTGEQATGKS